jgi:hypothetical protein
MGYCDSRKLDLLFPEQETEYLIGLIHIKTILFCAGLDQRT